MWKHYYKSTDGIIYVVDSTESGEERVEECKEALSLFIGEDLLRGCTLLVLANKQDLPDAMSIEEISEKLGLDSIKDRRWRKYQISSVSSSFNDLMHAHADIEGTCAISGEGMYEGLDWLHSALTEQKQS